MKTLSNQSLWNYNPSMHPERVFDPRLLSIQENVAKTSEQLRFFDKNVAHKTALAPDMGGRLAYRHFKGSLEGSIDPEIKWLYITLNELNLNDFEYLYVVFCDNEGTNEKTLGMQSVKVVPKVESLGIGYQFGQQGQFLYKFLSPEDKFERFRLDEGDMELLGFVTSNLKSFMDDFIFSILNPVNNRVE